MLEPVLSSDQTRIRTAHKMLNPKPDMSTSRLVKSDIMNKVKNFLPQMAEAEAELNTAIRNGEAHKLNIENVENDDRVIEMDVAMLKDKPENWTSDSEPDSVQSDTDNNDYTSDEDISSSSSCSSSSCSDKERKKSKNSSSNKTEKRPLIQELESHSVDTDEQPPTKISREDGQSSSSNNHMDHNSISSSQSQNTAHESLQNGSRHLHPIPTSPSLQQGVPSMSTSP